jgi:NhaP-type Na+/H+ or K+/H+ antiporter
MHDSPLFSPELTVALALVAGITAQVLATHIRLPGIVVLLATGVLLGPDVAGVLHPETLGTTLGSLVGFAVAVILFEGAMNLDLKRLRRAGGPIQRLISLGAFVTAVLSTVAARAIMQWDWGLSVLFGTLVIVTGPTVVTPLLKRLRVEHQVSTILEGEGVLIDAVGAISAYVALEIVLHPTPTQVALVVPSLAATLGVGTLIGVVGGTVLSKTLRWPNLIPEGLTNVFTLACVLAIFQGSEAAMHESGIAAVTVAGLVVRYLGTPVQREVLEFKEQLTVMLIGMLFVLLAADVRLTDVEALGLPGLLTVLVLVFIVRPATVLASTSGFGLSWQQQAFMSWMGPRGIVAAAVASLFAMELEHAGLEGGRELRALVFLVIAVTVVTAGLTGGLVAGALGLRRKQNDGWVILGGHQLARAVGRILREDDQDVILVDSNPANCHIAQQEGLRILHGDALKETTLGRLQLDTRAGALGVTRNEEINFLFVQKARTLGKLERLYVTLRNDQIGVNREMLHSAHTKMLFGVETDVDRWNSRLQSGQAPVERWVASGEKGLPSDGSVLPISHRRGKSARPFIEGIQLKKGDVVAMLVAEERRVQVEEALTNGGWTKLEPETPKDAELEDA